MYTGVVRILTLLECNLQLPGSGRVLNVVITKLPTGNPQMVYYFSKRHHAKGSRLSWNCSRWALTFAVSYARAWGEFFSLTHPPPSAACMHQWIGSALFKILVGRLFGVKSLSKPILGIVNWTLKNKLQWICNQNTQLFIHGNASQGIVCEVPAILLSLCLTRGWSVRHKVGNGLTLDQFPPLILCVNRRAAKLTLI